MAIVKKKIYPEYFNLVAKGKKRFEFRVADFEIKSGDMIILEEWDPVVKKYTGRSIVKKAGYIKKWTLDDLEKEFGQKESLEKHGFYIIQID